MLSTIRSCFWVESPIQIIERMAFTQENLRKLLDDGLEGGIAKDPESTYRGGKRSSWLKMKAVWTEDVVITGGVAAKGELTGQVGTLTIAQYNENGELVPLGQCWGEFNQQERLDLTELWKKDQLFGLVCEMKVMGWTGVRFRSPVITRIRQDKTPDECVFTDKSRIYKL